MDDGPVPGGGPATPPGAGEADLVRRCAAGDAHAWAEFVDRYGALVRVLARRMLERRTGGGRDADADEVGAEVFLALLRRDRLLLRRYDPRFRVSTYLGVICRTEVHRHLRRSGRRPQRLPGDSSPDQPAARGPGPLERLTEAERLEALGQLREALTRLPERDRLLLTLRYLEGLDYRAVAAALHLAPESVGPLLHRAKRRLAREVPALAAWIGSAGGSPG